MVSRMDWYRRKSWTKVDEEEFFARLGRARKDRRAQYLKIQALELIYTEDAKLVDVAETLLKKILNDFTDDRLERSQTYNALGEISRLRGDKEEALDYFKRAVDFEKEFPNVISSALLSFCEAVIELGRIEFYDEVEKHLIAEVNRGGILFPFQLYIIGSILAVLFAVKGDRVKAAHYADMAESNATANTNTLWNLRKRKYGLVEQRKIWLDELVAKSLALTN